MIECRFVFSRYFPALSGFFFCPPPPGTVAEFHPEVAFAAGHIAALTLIRHR